MYKRQLTNPSSKALLMWVSVWEVAERHSSHTHIKGICLQRDVGLTGENTVTKVTFEWLYIIMYEVQDVQLLNSNEKNSRTARDTENAPFSRFNFSPSVRDEHFRVMTTKWRHDTSSCRARITVLQLASLLMQIATSSTELVGY